MDRSRLRRWVAGDSFASTGALGGDGSDGGNPPGPAGSGLIEQLHRDWFNYKGLASRTTPFDGTTVDVHMVVAAVYPLRGCGHEEWGLARAALDAAVPATRAAGHEISVRD